MAAESAKLRLILAEDDDDDVDLFKEIILELPYEIEITVASNGLQLLHALEKAEVLPHVIYLDINMPIKNGLECLQAIRANERWKAIRVIMLSTATDMNSLAASRELGADLYVIKSASLADFRTNLVQSIKSHLPEFH